MSGFDNRAQQLLNSLREDYESGATTLALNTLKSLAAYVEATHPAPGDLTPLFDELRKARPSMIVIGNAMAKVESLLEGGNPPLAMAARAHNRPFWVLGDSFRHSNLTSENVTLEEMPVSELNAPEGHWIKPRNVYFETIPQSLVTGRISEQGVFSFSGSPRR